MNWIQIIVLSAVFLAGCWVVASSISDLRFYFQRLEHELRSLNRSIYTRSLSASDFNYWKERITEQLKEETQEVEQ